LLVCIKSEFSGTPKVLCEDNDVSLDVLTAKPFEGTYTIISNHNIPEILGFCKKLLAKFLVKKSTSSFRFNVNFWNSTNFCIQKETYKILECCNLELLTKCLFEGNIFVKGEKSCKEGNLKASLGRAKDENCKKSYSSNSTKSYTLGLGKCGMIRERTLRYSFQSFIKLFQLWPKFLFLLVPKASTL
jgi:hypothetical protein